MSHKNVFIFVISTALVVSACGSPRIASPTATPTSIPFSEAEPTLYSRMLSTCEEIINSGDTNYMDNLPSRILKPKSLVTVTINPGSPTQNDNIIFPYLEAAHSQDVAFILCIQESGQAVKYTGGAILWSGTWLVALVSWPEKKLIATQSFTFEPPATLGAGEAFGPSLKELSLRWLITGIDDETVHSYPGSLVSISPDFKNMIVWPNKLAGYEFWKISESIKLKAFTNDAPYLEVSPDWKSFAELDDAFNSLKVFKLQTMQEMYTLDIMNVQGYSYSLDGKTLATITSDALTLWNTSNGQQLKTMSLSNQGIIVPSFPMFMLFLNENSPVIVGQGSTSILVDMDQNETRMLGSDEQMFSPDGRRLVQFNASHGFIRDLPFGNDHKIYDHDRPVTALAFSPDGNTLALGDTDGQIILLSASDWRVKATMQEVHIGDIINLAFSPDGNELMSVSLGEIKFWSLKGGQ